jgi:hypothetical protein
VTVLEYLKVLISWPVAVVFLVVFFRAEIQSLLGRVKEANLPGGIKLVLDELAERAKPRELKASGGELKALGGEAKSPGVETSPVEMTVSPGAYSTDYRAIFVVVGIANRGDKPDQITSWKLHIASLDATLEPTPAPMNLLPTAPFWRDDLIRVQSTEFRRGTLFFRAAGILPKELPEEPLVGRLTATTLNRIGLSADVRIYRMSTLQQHPELDA